MAKTTTIAGNTFLFTGKLTEFTREDAEAHVEAEGGKVLSGVSAKLNYLVVGEDAGSKLKKAEALGTVTILHEKEFLKMMSSQKEKVNSKPTSDKTKRTKVFIGKKLLDVKTAKKSISDFVDLSEFDSIDPKAAAILAAEDSRLDLYWLKYLDADVAKELAKHTGALFLNGLEELDADVAKELAKHTGELHLDGLRSISPEVAKELSKLKFHITLGGIEEMEDASSFQLSWGFRQENDQLSGFSIRCLRDNYNGKLENLESEMHKAQIELSNKDKAQNNIEKTTLSVEIYSRGKEVYGLNYHHSNFNKLKFLKKHNDDYYELSDDCLESEVPIQDSQIFIYLGDHKIFDEEYKDGLYEKVKVLDSNKSESYRKLLNSKKDEIAVIWFHDYVNTIKYVWENIKEFDPTKLVVISKYRIDETDNSKYEIVSHIVYDSKEADEIETEGSPKSGYDGPFVI